MSSAPLAALIVALALAGVLLLSGVAKLRNTVATRDAFTALRVPAAVPADAAAAALPWVEIGAALLLLLAPAGWLTPVAIAVLALMLAYTAVIGRALGFEEPVTCSCFGSIGRHDVDRTTLARNVLLTALAALLVWFAVAGGSVPGVIGDLGAADWWALAAVVATVAVAVLIIGVGAKGGDAYPAGGELLDYERAAVPYAMVTDLDGTTSTLTELARTQARLLIVLSPTCGSCIRTMAKLADWAEQLAPAVGLIAVHPDEASARAAEHPLELAVWEPELNVRRVFSVGTPAAVLLGADGYLAGGPVAGENSVAEFVAEVVEVLAEQPEPAE